MNTETQIPLLLDLLLKSTAILALAALAYCLCRRSSAANRHVIATAALGALLLLPFTKLAPPRWVIRWERAADPAPMPLNVSPVIHEARPEISRDVERPAPAPAQPRTTGPGLNWAGVAVAIWLAGVVLVLAHRAGVSLQLHRLSRSSRPVNTVRILARARELAATSGVCAELRESDACRVPLAFGMWRPTVLLPANANDWSDERLSAALLHEFGHVRRRDCRTRLLSDLVCAFYWVNPLVWFGARVLRLAQEQACDDLVLNEGARPEDYACQLVDVVRALQRDRFAARHALAMAQPSTLETRVRAIVDDTRDRRPRSRVTTATGSLFVASVLAVCTAAQVLGADNDKAAAAMERGLAFLAKSQKEDGSVGAADLRGGVGVSSLAGLAWVGSPAHAGHLERLAKFIVSCQREDGFIVGAAPRGGSMYDHGFATLFLAEYSKAAARPELREKLAKAVALIVKSQGNEGAWRYVPSPGDGDVSVTACQLMALVAAQGTGVEVPAATIEKTVSYLKRCQNPDGGFRYLASQGGSAFPRSAAALAASMAARKSVQAGIMPDAAKGTEYVMGFLPEAGAPQKSAGFFIHGHYYAGQALRLGGGDTFERWQKAIQADLLASQKEDGSWADQMSPELGTSQACLILREVEAGR